MEIISLNEVIMGEGSKVSFGAQGIGDRLMMRQITGRSKVLILSGVLLTCVWD